MDDAGRRRPSVVMLGQTPPPYHGQAIVIDMLFGRDYDLIDLHKVRMAYSADLQTIGRFRLHKVAHLLRLTWDTIQKLRGLRDPLLFYPPAGPRYLPILRDIFFLGLVRPFATGVVFHFHAGGLGAFLQKRPLLRRLAWLAYRDPLVCIDLSAREKPRVGDLYGAKAQLVVRNGLDVPQLEHVGATDPPVILYVGNLSGGKGLFEMIETARILKSKGRPVRFSLIGEWTDLEERSQALSMIEAERLEEWVTFEGLVTGDAKWEAYHTASVFFYPSKFFAESYPLALIEALGSSLPTVATDWRGIPEIIEDGKTGMILPLDRPDLYADAIERLVFDEPDTAQEMRSAARTVYERKYSSEAFCLEIEAAILRAWELAIEADPARGASAG